MGDNRPLLGEMINNRSKPLRDVKDKYRKGNPGAEISSTLAGKPTHVVDAVKAKVEVMRTRHEQGLDLWTGEPIGDEKGIK